MSSYFRERISQASIELLSETDNCPHSKNNTIQYMSSHPGEDKRIKCKDFLETETRAMTVMIFHLQDERAQTVISTPDQSFKKIKSES